MLSGVLYPGGNRGGGRGGPSGTASSAFDLAGVGLDELPALPERTTFCGRLFGAMYKK